MTRSKDRPDYYRHATAREKRWHKIYRWMFWGGLGFYLVLTLGIVAIGSILAGEFVFPTIFPWVSIGTMVQLIGATGGGILGTRITNRNLAMTYSEMSSLLVEHELEIFKLDVARQKRAYGL